MIKPKVAKKLQKKMMDAKREMDAFVQDNFLGRIVVWDEEYSKYRGRKARIRQVIWDWSWDEEEDICVSVRVETERLDGKGYLEDNDSFHRTYWDLYRCFKEVK